MTGQTGKNGLEENKATSFMEPGLMFQLPIRKKESLEIFAELLESMSASVESNFLMSPAPMSRDGLTRVEVDRTVYGFKMKKLKVIKLTT